MQVLTEVMALCWAAAALLVQAKHVLRVNEFLTKHRYTCIVVVEKSCAL